MHEIEARNFTFCSAWYPAALTHHDYIVMTPARREAQERAMAYAVERWGQPEHVNVYPRKYVKDARRLFALGRHD
jgi:hypothetical protein